MKKGSLFCIVLLLCFTITGLIGCGEETEEKGTDSLISSTIPGNGAKDVLTTTAILVTFEEDIVTPSTADLAFIPNVRGSVSYDPDTRTLVFKP